MNIFCIQYDRYETDEGVFYSKEFIVGERYEYLSGRWSEVNIIFEEKYENGIRFHIVFVDGVEMFVNDRDDINLFWKCNQ